MIELIRESDDRKFYMEDMSGEKTLLRLLKEHGIFISAPCNGLGSCGSCRVRFPAGAPEPTEKEYRLLKKEELACGIRLACAVHVKEPCQILLLDSGESEMHILTAEGMSEKKGFLPTGGSISAKEELIQAAEKKAPSTAAVCWGAAIDIGTTTLAAELFDLKDGRTLALACGINHQRVYGADVVTRIAAANTGAAEKLRTIICADIAELISTLIKKTRYSVQEGYRAICRLAIVGNTTMCQLLRGLSCERLACAPFVPADNGWYEIDAGTLLGIRNCPAKVTILPAFSAFVGADIAAGGLACDIVRNKKSRLLLDIGTNGEMAFFTKGQLYVTSVAAGPVFEGGNVSGGMPAVSGAICQVTGRRQAGNLQAAKGGDICFETIDGRQPIGICGTGIIALTSVLLKEGYMDENGTLREPWFTEGIPLTKDGIHFTQGDIRQVQLGKAAIRAGIEILLKETREVLVCLAGGFGHFIDVDGAIEIGMLPPEFKAHAVSVGNSALKGAKKYLLEESSAKEQIDYMLGIAQNINLAAHPLFEELYLKYMAF